VKQKDALVSFLPSFLPCSESPDYQYFVQRMMMEDDSNKTWGVYGSVLILFSHFGFFASEPYYHRFIVVYLVSYCRTQGGMFFFFLKFLGHHEEEKKKIVTVLLLKKIIFIFIFLGSP